MRAVRSADGQPAVLDVDEPNGDWPVLDVGAAGICGSDLTLVGWNLPVTLGHEIAGTVDGRAYCVEPTVRCGECEQCLMGAPQRCRGAAPRGLLGLAFDGGMAERVAVPPECLVPLPDGLAARDASLVEPLAVSWHALRAVGARPGERALVVGGGSVGLLTVAAARAMGLQVDLEARHEHQCAAGERLGAGSPKVRYEITVEAAGSESAIATCVKKTAPGGRIAMVGMPKGDLRVPGIPFVMNELSMVGCNCYGSSHGSREFDDAARALAENPDIAAAVITHRFPLADAVEAFRVAGDRAAGAIKVVLEP